MGIVEVFVEGKDKDINKCEDGYVVTEDYAVVIDGVTSKSDLDFDGKSSGRYLMELVRDNIKNIGVNISAKEFICELTDIIKDEYTLRGWHDKFNMDKRYRPAVSMVVYSKYKKEIWFYGDCLAAKVAKDGGFSQINNTKKVDDLTSMVRRYIIEAEMRQGKTVSEIIKNDRGRDYIDGMLKLQQIFLNDGGDSIFSYSAVDGWGFNEKDIKVVKVTDKTDYIILASDGYKKLLPTVEETEENLKEQLKNDPLCVGELQGTKLAQENHNSIDDRLYLKLKV